MVGSTRSIHYKSLKRKAGKVREGTGINPSKKSVLFELFNCGTCPWRDTDLCIHDIKQGKFHANKICSVRILYVADVLRAGKGLKKAYGSEREILYWYMYSQALNHYQRTGDIKPCVKIGSRIPNFY